jgi:predicted  nucleic acid-binding Zn-ribbon protein
LEIKELIMADKKEISVEDKLKALFKLQQIDSEVDKIKKLRGELPLEVSDLEDELEGLQTRIKNYEDEVKHLQSLMLEKKNAIKESKGLIKKYEEQQMKVRNNREFDSISKEVEFQNLEIQLSEKRIKEFSDQLTDKEFIIKDSKEILDEKKGDLKMKKGELEEIIAETKKDEDKLSSSSNELESVIEERLLKAYKRIRDNVKNGLAVACVERDACGGCFNKIPPQKQLDVTSKKKIIVCEHCGRILVDRHILELSQES